MKHIKLIIYTFLITFAVGCSDDLLDKLPEDEISPEAYWKTPNDLALFLNHNLAVQLPSLPDAL